MRQTGKGVKGGTFLRKLAMVYILVVLPGVLIYISLLMLTEMRGRLLFNAFLPSALVFVILYLLYLCWPVLRQFGMQEHEEFFEWQEKDSQVKTRTRL